MMDLEEIEIVTSGSPPMVQKPVKRKLVSVEPVVGAYFVAYFLYEKVVSHLENQRGCYLEVNSTLCSQNSTTMDEITMAHTWQVTLQNIISLNLVMFASSYSDLHKLRVPFLLMPIYGQLFAVASSILFVIFTDLPLEILGVVQVVASLFGGQAMVLMVVFAYVADSSMIKSRTFRIGIVYVIWKVSAIVQFVNFAKLDTKMAQIWVLSVAAGLYLFALLYGLFCVKEPKQPEFAWNRASIFGVFRLQHATATINMLKKVDPSTLALLGVVFFYSWMISGESSILCLYFHDIDASWTTYTCNFHSLMNVLIVHFLATLLFLKCTKDQVFDWVLLCVGFAGKIVTNMIYSAADTTEMIVYTFFVTVFSGFPPLIILRSILTKVVAVEDFGKIQALLVVQEASGASLGPLIYHQGIYNNTMDFLPAAFLILGIFVCIPCVSVICWIWLKKPPSPLEVQ